MTDACESLRARQSFYSTLSTTTDPELAKLIRAIKALCLGYMNLSVSVENKTPNDMDGYVLKVTIS